MIFQKGCDVGIQRNGSEINLDFTKEFNERKDVWQDECHHKGEDKYFSKWWKK